MSVQRFNTVVTAFALCIFALVGHEVRASIFSDANVDANFIALPDPCVANQVYTEPHNDFPGAQGLHYLDIVGTTSFPAGFRYTDGTHLFFRMRVDQSARTLPQTVWQFLLDTDLDVNGYVNYSLQLDNKVDNAVELIPASPGGPLFAQVHLGQFSGDGFWRGDPGVFSERVNTNDNTDLGDTGPNDTYIDVAIPWADFTSQTGIASSNETFYGWRVYLTTSDSHIQVNKDTPICVGGPAVPEPASLAIWSLLGMGSWLGVRAWRRGKPVPR